MKDTTFVLLLLILIVGVGTGTLVYISATTSTAAAESYHVAPTYFIDDRFQPPRYAAFASWLGNQRWSTAFTAVPCTEGVLERIAKDNR